MCNANSNNSKKKLQQKSNEKSLKKAKRKYLN